MCVCVCVCVCVTIYKYMSGIMHDVYVHEYNDMYVRMHTSACKYSRICKYM